MTASCIVTLPIDIGSVSTEDSEAESVLPVATQSYITTGDLQEEVWFCSTYRDEETSTIDSQLSIVSFRGRANFSVERVNIGTYPVTAMCNVNQTVWLGTEDGKVLVYDSTTYYQMYSRILALKEGQSIVSIHSLMKLRQVRGERERER